MGNLKNRDLQGQEIMSQQSTRDNEEEQDESGDEEREEVEDEVDRVSSRSLGTRLYC